MADSRGGEKGAAAPEHRGGEPTDRELMARHVAGDADAFGEIFRRHRDRLWAVALRTLGNRDDASDALQDAMISAFRRADSYRGEAAVTTWLHRIVVNACLDRVRREAVRATDPLPDDDRSSEVAADRDEIGARETSIDVTAALATLPVEQRAALVLVDMAGYSVEDAAVMLAVAPGTIKSRCARGRAKLLPLVRPTTGSTGVAPTTSAVTNTVADAGNQTAARGVAPRTAPGDVPEQNSQPQFGPSAGQPAAHDVREGGERQS